MEKIHRTDVVDICKFSLRQVYAGPLGPSQQLNRHILVSDEIPAMIVVQLALQQYIHRTPHGAVSPWPRPPPCHGGEPLHRRNFPGQPIHCLRLPIIVGTFSGPLAAVIFNQHHVLDQRGRATPRAPVGRGAHGVRVPVPR